MTFHVVINNLLLPSPSPFDGGGVGRNEALREITYHFPRWQSLQGHWMGFHHPLWKLWVCRCIVNMVEVQKSGKLSLYQCKHICWLNLKKNPKDQDRSFHKCLNEMSVFKKTNKFLAQIKLKNSRALKKD